MSTEKENNWEREVREEGERGLFAADVPTDVENVSPKFEPKDGMAVGLGIRRGISRGCGRREHRKGGLRDKGVSYPPRGCLSLSGICRLANTMCTCSSHALHDLQ